MRVLLINSVCGIKSTGRICAQIAKDYMDSGNEVRIAYGRDIVPEELESISYKIGNKFSSYLNALKARIFDNEGFNAVKETNEFIKWAEEYDPDILWLHNLHGYYINIEILFNWIKSRPNMEVKWTLHDCWAFTGHCAYFTMVGCDKWKSQCENCPQKKSYPASNFLDRSFQQFNHKKKLFLGVNNMTIITPSKWLANLVKESFLKEYTVNVVYNTIDTNIFKPTIGNFREKYKLEEKYIILGVAAIWDERKGFKDFIELSNQINDDFVIVMVGLNKKQIKNLPSNIIGIERTNSAIELAEIYTAADVFLNLTYEDNYPTVNLEAQACGTPCITYKTGGSVESVPTSLIVDVGDLSSVIATIYTLLKIDIL